MGMGMKTGPGDRDGQHPTDVSYKNGQRQMDVSDTETDSVGRTCRTRTEKVRRTCRTESWTASDGRVGQKRTVLGESRRFGDMGETEETEETEMMLIFRIE